MKPLSLILFGGLWVLLAVILAHKGIRGTLDDRLQAALAAGNEPIASTPASPANGGAPLDLSPAGTPALVYPLDPFDGDELRLSAGARQWIAERRRDSTVSGVFLVAPREVDDDPSAVYTLLEAGDVEVEPIGSGIRSVELRLRRRGRLPLHVTIPPGTFFEAHDSEAQNMITRAEETVLLDTDEWVHVRVPAACANIRRRVPDGEHRFSLRRGPDREALNRLMPVLVRASAGYAVEQAAIWIVTDDASYAELGTLQDGRGGRTIGAGDTVRAMRLVAEAGIDLRTRAAWQDRHVLAEALPDDDPDRTWLLEEGPARPGSNVGGSKVVG